MKLYQTKINTPLMLDDVVFKSGMNNIDHLISEALKSNSLYLQLELLSLAAKKAEKFHSFFHFEQSYFHTQFAIFLTDKGESTLARLEFEKALFQDHINIEAKELLSFGHSDKKYGRLFNSFIEYIRFATDEDHPSIKPSGYWRFDTHFFEEIIQDIKNRHLLYHQEAAKIYYNRSRVFRKLGEFDLSKNDVVKAENLDAQIILEDF